MRGLFIFLFSISATLVSSQEVTKTVIVEHYTNTYCSVCASRNPGFYTNLNNHPDVLHIAYHPSAPYSSCPLSQHNVNENDARTMYYGIYGGTPRLVVQGNVIPTGDDYSSPTIFDPYENQTTAFDMTTTITQNSTLDSVVVEVIISKVATSGLDSLNLYTAITEETLNFNANNGETVHHDVFRKSLVGENPFKIKLPEQIGEDTTITFMAKIDDVWNGNELKSVALLQNEQKQVEQADESSLLDFTASLSEIELESVVIYPNPAHSEVQISAKSKIYRVQLLSSKGHILSGEIISNTEHLIDMEDYPNGMYFFRVYTDQGVIMKKVVKQ